MRRIVRTWVLALLALGVICGPALAQPQAARVTVFAAASLKNALDEVDAAFAQRSAGVAVSASYAASSTLARQIEQGAPADLFISADADWMDYVARKKLLRPGTRRDLLTNNLALIAATGSSIELAVRRGMPLAKALGSGRLALAGPDVPAGRYSRQALMALDAWDQVRDRTALGENVRATLQFVARGEAPLGVVYDTDAKIEPRVRIVGLFPADSHPRIVYPVAVIAGSSNPAAAGYLSFLASPTASAIFRKYGFTPVAR